MAIRSLLWPQRFPVNFGWAAKFLFCGVNKIVFKGRTFKAEIREQKVQNLRRALITGQNIAIDFSLPDIMTEKDKQTLFRQVKLLYHSNMNCQAPASLSFIGLEENPLVNRHFKECFQDLKEIVVNFVNRDLKQAFPDKKLVYLTPDASEALHYLDKNEVYILGGLVDYQVRKNTTLRRAKELSFEARRLPIPEYMERKDGIRYNYSRILAINQVFEILLKYQETSDWKQSLPVGLPARRGFIPRP